jgi:hypothetical protein
MWRCCICLDGQFTAVQEYASHVEVWHPEWLEGKRVPPPAMKPSWLLDREAERQGWV